MSYFPKRGVRVQMGSLSGDVLTEEQWRDAMLSEQRQVREWQERWVKKDEFQRWMQFAATLSIPLAAAAWKWILGRRAARTST